MRVRFSLVAALAAILTVGALAAPAQAAIQPVDLAGNQVTDTWNALTAANYPGNGSFPGTGAWSNPPVSNEGGAVLNKIANGSSGGVYPASSGLYFGGFSANINENGGTLAVQVASAMTNLAQVVFQIEIGEAWTYDFYDHVLPVLNYATGTGSGTLTAAVLGIEKVFTGTVTMPSGEEDVFVNTYTLQWDLTSIVDPIDSFDITFTGVQHAQLYGIQLDQSDALC